MKKLLLFSMMLFAFVGAKAGLTYSVTVPAGTKVCYIAGAMNGWKPQEMTKVDETHYTITHATATTAHQYKYCSGPGFAYEENIVGNRTVYNANDVVVSWKAVYDPAALPVPVTYSVTVPATDKCFFNGAATGWVFTEMVKVSPTNYTLTLNIVPTLKDNYKYSAGASWNYEEQTAVGGNVSNRTYAASDVVEKWKSLPTSIEQVDALSSVVTTSNNQITVKFEGVAKVDIYTITGTLVSSVVAEGEVSQSVNSGAYIVVVGEKATKVLVK